MFHKKIAAGVGIILIFFSCATPQKARRITLTGKAVASWYGPKFHGRATASGETYDMHDLTCAHKTLPFGTQVRIRNIENDLTVIVRVNDRGPFVRGRDFDLSYGAARKIDMIGPGVAEVYYECLEFGPGVTHDQTQANQTSMTYTVQVGSFKEEENAFEFKKTLSHHFSDVRITPATLDTQQYHRVKVGCFHSIPEAEKVLRKLEKSGYTGFVVACSETDECH